MSACAPPPFGAGPPPPGFVRRTVAVPPSAERRYDAREWRDAVVLLACGELELVGRAGARRFVGGDVLCLDGLPLRALRNRGPEPAVLVAVTRRR